MFNLKYQMKYFLKQLVKAMEVDKQKLLLEQSNDNMAL